MRIEKVQHNEDVIVRPLREHLIEKSDRFGPRTGDAAGRLLQKRLVEERRHIDARRVLVPERVRRGDERRSIAGETQGGDP